MSGTSSEVSPNMVRPGGYLCYVNGLLVPVVSVEIDCPTNDIPAARIEFFPSRTLYRLGAEDRVEVVIFYLDTHYNPASPTYRLLFDGEIVGWGYQASPEGRAVSVNASADISIFQQTFYTLLNTTHKAGSYYSNPGNSSATVGSVKPSIHFGLSLLQDGLFYTGATEGSSPTEQPTPTIQTPYELLYNAVVGMSGSRTGTGVVIPNELRSLPVVNFFSRWARRRNFVNRFVALPDFDDIRDAGRAYVFPLIRSAKAYEALVAVQKDIISDMSNGSIWDILSRAFQELYYEVASLATPPAVRVDLKTGKIRGGIDSESSGSGTPIRLANYYAKPVCVFGAAPTCNVVFPSMVRSISYTENYRTQPTRVYYQADTLYNQSPIPDPAMGATMAAYPPAAQAGIFSRYAVTPDGRWPAGQVVDPNTTGRNLLIWPEEFYKGPVVQDGAVPPIFSMLAKRIGLDPGAAASAEADETGMPEELRVRTLVDLYAESQFFRARYGARGGSVQTVFDPYIVPGYPTIIFDRAGGLHQVGYVHTVRHSLSSNGMATSFNYSMGRTLNEWLALLKNESERLGVVLMGAPAEPVDDVRQIMQDPGRVENHYQKLFYPGGIEDTGAVARRASFDPRDVIQVGGAPVIITGPSESEVPLQSRPQAIGPDGRYLPPDLARRQVTASIDFSGDVTPTETHKILFTNTHDALTYVARPVCTLEEYVCFVHGVASAGDAPPDQVNGEHEAIPGTGATAYLRIKKLNYGAASTPAGVTGVTTTPARTIGDSAADGAVVTAAAPASLPYAEGQTRVNWDSVLLAYREEIWYDVGPKE